MAAPAATAQPAIRAGSSRPAAPQTAATARIAPSAASVLARVGRQPARPEPMDRAANPARGSALAATGPNASNSAEPRPAVSVTTGTAGHGASAATQTTRAVTVSGT